MGVSKTLRGLAEYVNTACAEERAFALCVFTDVALKEGTKEAERYCAEVLSYHLCEQNAEDQLEDVSTKAEELTARKVTVDQLLEVASRFDRFQDKDVLVRIVKSAMMLLETERDDGIRAKLTRFLASLGVPLKRIPQAPTLQVLAYGAMLGALSVAA